MAKRTTEFRTTVERVRKTEPRSRPARRVATTKTVKPSAAPLTLAPAPAPMVEPTATQIEERAYFLSLDPHRSGGPLDDWLQAERELRNGFAQR